MIPQLIRNERFVNIQTAQAGLTKLLVKAGKEGIFYRVLKNDEPLGVLIPENMWQNLIEDLEALSSPRYLNRIAKARKNKTYSADDIKRILDL